LYLVVVEGQDAGRWIELGARPLTAGRDPDRDLVLAHGEVSRLHFLVSVVDGTVIVEDCESTNGTFVDDQRIGIRSPLAVGSLLRVGEWVFKCERCYRRDVVRALERHRDLERASKYVLSLLPPPVPKGRCVQNGCFCRRHGLAATRSDTSRSTLTHS
jgi:pSer/pThr/pTyr-binding forkhead associated (FHA) protein